MIYTDEQKRLAQTGRYQELLKTVDFSVPNPFSAPEPHQTSLLALCLDITGNLSLDMIKGTIRKGVMGILKQLLRYGARLHDRDANKLASALKDVRASGDLLFEFKKYVLLYGLIPYNREHGLQYNLIQDSDLALILNEFKKTQDPRAQQALITSFGTSFKKQHEASFYKEEILEPLLESDPKLFSLAEKQAKLSRYFNIKCRKGLTLFAIKQINKFFCDPEWRDFFRTNKEIRYAVPFSLQASKKKAVRYQHYLAYLLSPIQKDSFTGAQKAQFFDFLLVKLHEQSPDFQNLLFKLPRFSEVSEPQHLLAWLLMEHDYTGLESLFKFVKQYNLHLCCEVLGFNFWKKEFGELETFLEERCQNGDIFKLADYLYAIFMGESLQPIYRSLKTDKRKEDDEVSASSVAADEMQASGGASELLSSVVSERFRSGVGIARKRKRLSVSSADGPRRSASLGQSGEGLQHLRRSSKSLFSPVLSIPEQLFEGGVSGIESPESLGDEDELGEIEQRRSAGGVAGARSSAAPKQTEVFPRAPSPRAISPEVDTDDEATDTDSEDEPEYSLSYSFDKQFNINPECNIQPGKQYAILGRGLHFYRKAREEVPPAEAASAADSPKKGSFFDKAQRKAFRKKPFADQDAMAVRQYRGAGDAVQAVQREYQKLCYADPASVLRNKETGAEYLSAADLHQQIFSNSTRRYNKLISDISLCHAYLQGANFAGSPFVSTTPRLHEAMRYALGDRYANSEDKSRRLRPRYQRATGRPKYPYSGKVYIFAFTAEELQALPHNVVMQLYGQGKAHIDYRIVGEEEVSFIAQIPRKHILAEMVVRFPRFDKPYHSFMEKKYGLTPQQYQEFKEKIQNSARGTEARRAVKRDITKILLEHLEKQARDFIRRTLGEDRRVYHRLDAVGIDERGLDRNPMTLAVARLYRQFHLSQPYVNVLSQEADHDKRLSFLQSYISAWDQNKLPELYLLRFLVALSGAEQEILDKLRQLKPQAELETLIDFVNSKRVEIHLLRGKILEDKFNSKYKDAFSWLEDLFLKQGASFEVALLGLSQAQTQTLRQLTAFTGLVTGLTPAAVLLQACKEKEESGALAVLWEGQDDKAKVPRGRAAGAKPGEFHLEKTKPTPPLDIMKFAPIALPPAVPETLDVGVLIMAIRLGQTDKVKAYLKRAEERALSAAERELGQAVDSVSEKKKQTLAWQKYRVFLGEPSDNKTPMITPLHYACGYQGTAPNLEIVKLLLTKSKKLGNHQLSVVIQEPDKHHLPLHLAAMAGVPEIITKILKARHNHNANQQDADGNTPLHLAAKEGHLAIVNCLLLHATPSPKNRDDKTPADLAIESGHQQVRDLLLPLDKLMQGVTTYCVQASGLVNRRVKPETQAALLQALTELNAGHDEELRDFARIACESHKYFKGHAGQFLDAYGRTVSYLVCHNAHLDILSELMKLRVNINFAPERYSGTNRLYPAFLEAILAGKATVVKHILKQDWSYLYTTLEGQGSGLFAIKKEGKEYTFSADAFRFAADQPEILKLLQAYHEQHKETLKNLLGEDSRFDQLTAEIDKYLTPSDSVSLKNKRRKLDHDDAAEAATAVSSMDTELDEPARTKRKRRGHHVMLTASDESDDERGDEDDSERASKIHRTQAPLPVFANRGAFFAFDASAAAAPPPLPQDAAQAAGFRKGST